jgi:hypothetical protein
MDLMDVMETLILDQCNVKTTNFIQIPEIWHIKGTLAGMMD